MPAAGQAPVGCILTIQLPFCPIMVLVLGFLSCQDEDLPDAFPPLIWLDGHVPEGSAGEFYWATHAWRLLDG